MSNGNGADKDPDGDLIEIIKIGLPNSGGMALVSDNGSPANPLDDIVAYSPAGNFIGDEVFSYTISDGVFTSTASVDGSCA